MDWHTSLLLLRCSHICSATIANGIISVVRLRLRINVHSHLYLQSGELTAHSKAAAKRSYIVGRAETTES